MDHLLFAITIAAVAWRDVVGGFSLLRSRLLVALGDWSFAFYLVHATIIYAVLAVVGHQPSGWGALGWTAALLVASLAGAAALHYAIERPFERRMRRWWDARRERRAAAPAATAAAAAVDVTVAAANVDVRTPRPSSRAGSGPAHSD